MKLKSLKKASAVLLCALITLAGVLNVFAAGKAYSIPEASNMQITLPEDMTAVTRSSDANDKYFSLFGIDYNSTMQRFESSNIYLQGMNSSSDLTVTVSVQTTDQSTQLVNYNQLESDKLSEVARNFLSQTEYTACTVDQVASNAVWLEFDIRVNESGSLIQAYQANTVYEGKSINITLQRNGGNVTVQDYEVFSQIVQSAEFGKLAIFNLSNPAMPYILIGAGVLLILIIVFIIIIVRTAKRRKKKSRNDKILEELAGKYSSNRTESGRGGRYSDGKAGEDNSAQADTAESSYDLDNFDRAEAKKSEPERRGRRYSDDEINALLGDDKGSEGEKPNFTQALPKAEEEQERAKDDTLSKADQVSEFFEDEPTQEEVPSETKKFDIPDKSSQAPLAAAAAAGAVIAAENEEPGEPSEAEDTAEASENQAAENAEEITETIPEVIENTEVKPVLTEPEAEETKEVTEESEAQKAEEAEEIAEEAQAEPETAAEQAYEADEIPEAEIVSTDGEAGAPELTVKIYGEKPGKDERKKSLREEIKNAIREFESDDEDDDEQFNNDEVLVRAEAKRTRFADSNDYFDEAPKRVMGVISSKDIQNAEEYDVIGEMERRADEFEKEPPKKSEKFKSVVRSIAGGIKSFFVHCGYFITNVRREIKRQKAIKKRRQYEEDRRRRARERAERQRLQAENGGLVQVHKRTDRKPPQRRPSNEQRRPSSSQNRRGNPPRRR